MIKSPKSRSLTLVCEGSNQSYQFGSYFGSNILSRVSLTLRLFIKFESRDHATVSVSFCLLFRLVIADLNESRTAKDLAEQCIKVLELICTREAGGVFEAGGLTCVLGFIRDNGGLIHKDTLHSAMAVVSRLCSKMEPNEDSLGVCSYNFFFYYVY